MSTRIVSRTEGNMHTPLAMEQHFSTVAEQYRNLRKTDTEPIDIIVNKLKDLPHIEAADVGCGAGRYDLLLYKNLGNKLKLNCLDANQEMLKQLEDYLSTHGINNFTPIRSIAENLPFPDNSLDCVCTFNAVHHFNLQRFLSESARILKRGGYLFIYTRLREQNRRNIWGRYFPKFNQKETRLYSLNGLKHSIEGMDDLVTETVVNFLFSRNSNLGHLLERVQSHHYSTFFLYTPEELMEAIEGFTSKIMNIFKDVHNIRWSDENSLFIVRKGA
ncbi:MAG: class I SAM-dependent methyltransferase [Dehalococcoidales bacterium]